MKRKLLFIALLLIPFYGCQVKPEETINGFLTAIAEKNMHSAAAFCTESFKNSITNLPFAKRNFNYGVKKIKWNVLDIFPSKSGLKAQAPITIFRDWPAPEILKSLLSIELVKVKNKWYISSIQIIIPTYPEFVEKPLNNDRYYTFALTRPRWERNVNVNEPLPAFLKRYDEDCRSWLY